MGWNSDPVSMVMFDNCIVPKRNLIGKIGEGFKIAMKGLDGGRINIGSCSLGGASLAINETAKYIQDRKQFGKSLSEFQNNQFKLSEMTTKLVASRLMLRNAAQMIDNGSEFKTVHSAMAKYFSTENCFEIANQAVQMHGGYGYLKDYHVERIFRDLRVHMILEGTNEIMRMIISRNILNNKKI